MRHEWSEEDRRGGRQTLKEREMLRQRATLLLHGKSNKRQDHCPGGTRFIAPVRGGVEKRENLNSHLQAKRPCRRLFLRWHTFSFCLSAFLCALCPQLVCFLIEIEAWGDARVTYLTKRFHAEIQHENLLLSKSLRRCGAYYIVSATCTRNK